MNEFEKRDYQMGTVLYGIAITTCFLIMMWLI